MSSACSSQEVLVCPPSVVSALRIVAVGPPPPKESFDFYTLLCMLSSVDFTASDCKPFLPSASVVILNFTVYTVCPGSDDFIFRSKVKRMVSLK